MINPGDKVTERCRLKGKTLTVDMWYPRTDSPGTVAEVRVGLVDVRAADEIIIRYDFERDGYVVLQELCVDEGDAMSSTGEQVERAFIPAWCVHGNTKGEGAKIMTKIVQIIPCAMPSYVYATRGGVGNRRYRVVCFGLDDRGAVVPLIARLYNPVVSDPQQYDGPDIGQPHEFGVESWRLETDS